MLFRETCRLVVQAAICTVPSQSIKAQDSTANLSTSEYSISIGTPEILDESAGNITLPIYRGGWEGLLTAIRARADYPECAKMHKWTGKIDITFKVLSNGDIFNVVVLDDYAGCINDVAVTAIRLIGPFEKPATRNGEPVATRIKLPVIFQIDGMEESSCIHHHSCQMKHQAMEFVRAKQWQDGIDAFNKAINLNEYDMFNYYGRSLAYMGLGKYVESEQDLSKVIGTLTRPSLNLWYHRGNVRLLQGNNTGAEFDFSQVLTLDGKHVEALIGRAKARYSLHKIDGALKDLQKAMRVDPRNAETHYQMGIIGLGQKEFALAIASLTEAIGLNPEYAMAYHARGMAKARNGDMPGACADWKSATEKGYLPSGELTNTNCN